MLATAFRDAKTGQRVPVVLTTIASDIDASGSFRASLQIDDERGEGENDAREAAEVLLPCRVERHDPTGVLDLSWAWRGRWRRL